MESKKIFETQDLYLAAALKTHGFRLLDLRKDMKTRRGVFVFEDGPDRVECVKKYFKGELTGSLKAFANAWSDLKAMVAEV